MCVMFQEVTEYLNTIKVHPGGSKDIKVSNIFFNYVCIFKTFISVQWIIFISSAVYIQRSCFLMQIQDIDQNILLGMIEHETM